MPASYRQPFTDTVRSYSRIDQANRPSGSPDVGLRVSPNGRIVDYRSPEQAGRNELLRAAPLQEFIKTVGEVGSTVAQSFTNARMSLRAGEILSDPDVMKVIAQGGPEARRILLPFSPEAKSQIVSNVANSLVPGLREELVANVAANKNFNDRNWLSQEHDAETWAKEFQAIQPKQLEQLNTLVRLDPNGTQNAVLQFQQAQGQIRYQLRAKALQTRQEVGKEQIALGLTNLLKQTTTELDGLRLYGSNSAEVSKEDQGEVDKRLPVINAWIDAESSRFGVEKGELLRVVLADMMSKVETLTAEGQAADGQVDTSELVQATRELGLLTLAAERMGEGGASPIYERDQGGVRFIDRVKAFRAKVGGTINALEDLNNQQLADRLTLETFMGEGDPDQTYEQNALPLINEFAQKGDYSTALKLQQAWLSARDRRQSWTDEQKRDAAEEWESKAHLEAMANGRVSVETLNQGLRIPGNEGRVRQFHELEQNLAKEKKAEIMQSLAGRFGSIELTQDMAKLRQALSEGVTAKRYKPGDWFGREGSDGPVAKDYTDALYGLVIKDALALERKYGKKPTDEQIQQLFDKNRPLAQQMMLKKVPALPGQDKKASQPDPGFTYRNEWFTFEAKYKAAGGAPRPDLLPKRILDQIPQQGRTPAWVFSEGLRQWARQMEGITTPDGKPLLPGTDRQPVYQWMQDRMREATKDRQKVSSIGPAAPEAVAMLNRSLGTLQQYGVTGDDLGFTARLQQEQAGGTTLATVPTETTTESVVTDAPQGVVDMKDKAEEAVSQKMGRAVLDMAGVTTTTATPEGPVKLEVVPLNATPEGMKLLGRLSTGRESLQPDSPPLPQAPAEAPTPRLPLKVTGSRHPWLYAMVLSKEVAIRRRGGQALLAPEWMKGGRMSVLDGAGGSVEKVSSLVYERPGGQGGIDVFFESGRFPAVLPGVVKEVGWEGGYGNFVVIESIDPKTGQKVDVLYGHLGDARGQGISVREGQQVNAGQIIGQQGSTGNVDAPAGGGRIASIDFLAPAAKGSGSMAKYTRYMGLRAEIGSALQKGRLISGPPAAPRLPAKGAVTGFTTYYSGSGGQDGVAGGKTANGETYNPQAMTAAVQWSLKPKFINKWVIVEDVDTGKTVRVWVNDTGPMLGDKDSPNQKDPRVLDLSEGAFKRLFGSTSRGKARIRFMIDPNQKGRPS